MTLCPTSCEELAEALRDAGSRGHTITVLGHNSKHAMAGPMLESEVTVSTSRLNRILQYEPRDLTISVEAGIPYSVLSRTLAENGQMIPLDPPFAEDCTIGGVVAANVSGARRRVYGTARDMVIGMKFVTVEGKIVQSGGMVVKNVAGLDMAKMMIGSFGTLAAIAVVNFKLSPIPPQTRTFVRQFTNIQDAIGVRDDLHKGVLQPIALDIVKENGTYRLLAQGAGNQAVLERYARELKQADSLGGGEEEWLWTTVREHSPSFLLKHNEGSVIRVSSPLTDVGKVLASFPEDAVARAGSGICYGYFENWRDGVGRGVMEYGPADARMSAELWPRLPKDFETMKKVKAMFDPGNLLNRRRLYGRI